MSKVLESLSKDLASGVSRRKAMWKFATGLAGIAGLGLLTTKKASATSPLIQECIDVGTAAELDCEEACFETCTGLRGTAYLDCIISVPVTECVDDLCAQVYDEAYRFCLESGGEGAL